MILPDNYQVWKIAKRDNGTACVILAYSPSGDFSSSYETNTLGWFDSETTALEMTQAFVNEHGENAMNVLKNTKKLFPHIKGAMLMERPVTLHLSGKWRELLPDANAKGDDKSRLEIYFQDNDKTAVVNATQVLKIVAMYGAESDNWVGQPVVLYAEEGVAFGNKYTAIRIADMTDAADKRNFGHFLKPKKQPKATTAEEEQSGALSLFEDDEAEAFPVYE